jgi:hypothetical protein
MNKNAIPELIDDLNPEWTQEEVARAIPFSGLPESLRGKLV